MEEKDITRKKEKSFGSLVSALGNLYNRVNQTNNQAVDEDKELAKCVMQAYEEWQSAENFFHSVADPDLVDHAIYKLEATKARYIYLLKQAKANGIRMNSH
ncbi:YaaL family protein [Alkaliphilus sp. MSJ-5]|uniref:YaaL family protein n=1 Tax=Alkaliphilus flagellatus TaxID=2841507 RepID=A0ABS6G1I1_9FIRM|nr:YaaL family protein [Alkaliphilus flagellatus]MBU5676345.1 YaaL family protein [Alkaliphilus flagellatus]